MKNIISMALVGMAFVFAFAEVWPLSIALMIIAVLAAAV